MTTTSFPLHTSPPPDNSPSADWRVAPTEMPHLIDPLHLRPLPTNHVVPSPSYGPAPTDRIQTKRKLSKKTAQPRPRLKLLHRRAGPGSFGHGTRYIIWSMVASESRNTPNEGSVSLSTLERALTSSAGMSIPKGARSWLTQPPILNDACRSPLH